MIFGSKAPIDRPSQPAMAFGKLSNDSRTGTRSVLLARNKATVPTRRQTVTMMARRSI